MLHFRPLFPFCFILFHWSGKVFGAGWVGGCFLPRIYSRRRTRQVCLLDRDFVRKLDTRMRYSVGECAITRHCTPTRTNTSRDLGRSR